MSPEPFVSRAKALPAKRNEKGYGDEDGAWGKILSPRRESNSWPLGALTTELRGILKTYACGNRAREGILLFVTRFIWVETNWERGLGQPAQGSLGTWSAGS